MGGEEFIDRDRLAETEDDVPAVMEEIGVVDAGRNDDRRPFGRTGKGDAGDAFSDGEQRMHGTVTAFREHTEGHIVGQDFVDLVEDFVIAHHIADTVPAAYHRKDSEETQDGGDGLLLENIRPGTENGGAVAASEDDERVHERIAMVRRNQHGAAFWQTPLNPELSVAQSGTEIHIGAQRRIAPVPFPNPTHGPVSCG